MRKIARLIFFLGIIAISLLVFLNSITPHPVKAQYSGNLAKISGSVLWGTTATSLNNLSEVKFVGTTTGFTYSTNLTGNGIAYDSGYSLPADTYTVTLFVNNPDGGPSNTSYASTVQTVVAGAGQAVTANIDLSQTTGLVQGTLKINGVNSGGYVQFCPPAPASCPIIPNSSIYLSSSNGPIFVFGASGFKAPVLPGSYQAHVVSLSGVNVGIVPITVTAGQVNNDSSLQFQLNFGKVSGSVLWASQSTNLTNLSEIRFVGNTTGFHYTANLINNGIAYDTGFSLPADTYTVTLFVNNPDGGPSNMSYASTAQTVVVGTGQTAILNFDLSETTGLAQGSLKINGVSSGGYVQFCPPAPASCPVIPNSSIYFSSSNGPIFVFGASGFKAPILAGNYQAHVVSLSGVNVGIVPVTISTGQINNNSSLQFQSGFGKISGSVLWGTTATSLSNLSEVKFVGSTTGFTYSTNLTGNGIAYDSGYLLPVDTYTVTLVVNNPDGGPSNTSYTSTAQAVVVGSGQAVVSNIDLSQTTGLVQGTLKINGVNSGGYIQFCPPAPASCPVIPNSSIYLSSSNGPIFVFGAGGFKAPVLPGNYQAHVISLSGVDMGIFPVNVVIGQIINLAFSDISPTPTPTPTVTPTPTPTPIPTHHLTGVVYVDINENGAQDNGEQGYSNATITLDTGQTTVTNLNGEYIIPNLLIGSYIETLTVPSGYTVTTTNPVNLTISGDTNQNFGIIHNNIPPVINSISSTNINEGDNYSTSGSFTDSDSSTWTATVDYGDGSGVQLLTLSGTNFTLSHLFKDNGNYTVTVSITDNQNATSIKTAIITVNNVIPEVGAINAPITVVPANSSQAISVSFTDPGVLDTHIAAWDWGDNTSSSGTVAESNGSGSIENSHTYTTGGVYTITVTVTDKDGGVGQSYTTISVNLPPTANAGGPYTVNEGSNVALSSSGLDPESQTLTYSWDLDNNGTYETIDQNPLFAGVDGPNTQTVGLKVCDSLNSCATDTALITINNVAPTVGAITVPVAPVAVNTAVSVSDTFTDPGILDTHTAYWNFGDGNVVAGTVSESNGSGNVSDTHTYAQAGIYAVTLSLADKDGAVVIPQTQYVTVYDVAAGWVTGSKEYTSPVGAVTSDPSATGKAEFGFTAKYDNGSIVPIGSKWAYLNFTSGSTNINFTANTYSSLVIGGSKAFLSGSGTLNGQSGYTILISGIDNGNGQVTDYIRYQIKDSSGNVVYDSQPGNWDYADPITAVTKGKIDVH